VAGAGLGAIIGNQSGHTAEGAAIGAAVGALGGALAGKEVESRRNSRYAAPVPGQHSASRATRGAWTL